MRHENCGVLIKQIHDAVSKRVNNTLRENGLTLSQMRLLMELGEGGGAAKPLKELERLFGVAQSTIAGIVGRLEAKGFVAGFTAPDDNRVKLVKLTLAGEQLRENNMRTIERMENRMIAGLTETERLEFMRALRVVCKNVK
jgi:DNA-binding MarR family transcriptional regulator